MDWCRLCLIRKVFIFTITTRRQLNHFFKAGPPLRSVVATITGVPCVISKATKFIYLAVIHDRGLLDF